MLNVVGSQTLGYFFLLNDNVGRCKGVNEKNV